MSFFRVSEHLEEGVCVYPIGFLAARVSYCRYWELGWCSLQAA